MNEADCPTCRGRGTVPLDLWGPVRCTRCGGKGKVIVLPAWRAAPPTVTEVKANAWWWNKPAGGSPPHVMHFDVDVDAKDGDPISVVEVPSSMEPFDPNDWPGEWAPAVPPP